MRNINCKGLFQSLSVVVFCLVCFISYGQNGTDTIQVNVNQQQVNQDSVFARLKFIRDSIEVREKFVRDSILRRKQILDSVTFLQGELQTILDAVHWTMKEDVISHADQIPIIGDSALGDYVYYKLPLTLSGPYAPWKGTISLNPKQFRFNLDKAIKRITMVQAPMLKVTLSYANQGAFVIIQELPSIQNSATLGKIYKIPIDTVFYDRYKRITRIKRYEQLFTANNNQKGSTLFTNLIWVKQYEYGAKNQMTKYELTRFYERATAFQPTKTSGIISYSILKQGNNYVITRRNNPANNFSDGSFTLEYDENDNIKGISFRNLSNALIWQRFVELNAEGNVNCYIDKKDGFKTATQCMIYHKEPNAKYPVETMVTSFDKDGVDYMQKNITTNKVRVRDQMTLEWGPWKDE